MGQTPMLRSDRNLSPRTAYYIVEAVRSMPLGVV
jgi:hypothetical protein